MWSINGEVLLVKLRDGLERAGRALRDPGTLTYLKESKSSMTKEYSVEQESLVEPCCVTKYVDSTLKLF